MRCEALFSKVINYNVCIIGQCSVSFAPLWYPNRHNSDIKANPALSSLFNHAKTARAVGGSEGGKTNGRKGGRADVGTAWWTKWQDGYK